MKFTLDHLAAVVADEFLLDDTELLLADEDGTDLADICGENARTAVAARALPLDIV